MLSLNEKILSDFFLTKNVLIINDQRHIFIILWGNLRGENERLLRESALGAATSGLTMVDVVVVMVVVVVVVVVVVLFVHFQHSSSLLTLSFRWVISLALFSMVNMYEKTSDFMGGPMLCQFFEVLTKNWASL